jgi:hypothetical protein
LLERTLQEPGFYLAISFGGMASFVENYDPDSFQTMFRPKKSTYKSPRAWWKFAIQCVIYDLRKRKRKDYWGLAVKKSSTLLHTLKKILLQIPSLDVLSPEQLSELLQLSVEKAQQLSMQIQQPPSRPSKSLEAILYENEVLTNTREVVLRENQELSLENAALKKMLNSLLMPKQMPVGVDNEPVIYDVSSVVISSATESVSSSGSNSVARDSSKQSARGSGEPQLLALKTSVGSSPFDISSIPPTQLPSKYVPTHDKKTNDVAKPVKVQHLNYVMKEKERKNEIIAKKNQNILVKLCYYSFVSSIDT